MRPDNRNKLTAVVAVAAAGAVDEHDVVGADLRPPAGEARVVRGGAQTGAALPLHLRRHRESSGRLSRRVSERSIEADDGSDLSIYRASDTFTFTTIFLTWTGLPV